MAYVSCMRDAAPASPGVENHALARFFFPAGGAILSRHRIVSQGEFADRPSTLCVEVKSEAQVLVGGDVLEIEPRYDYALMMALAQCITGLSRGDTIESAVSNLTHRASWCSGNPSSGLIGRCTCVSLLRAM
jgi:hypothetical protein